MSLLNFRTYVAQFKHTNFKQLFSAPFRTDERITNKCAIKDTKLCHFSKNHATPKHGTCHFFQKSRHYKASKNHATPKLGTCHFLKNHATTKLETCHFSKTHATTKLGTCQFSKNHAATKLEKCRFSKNHATTKLGT